MNPFNRPCRYDGRWNIRLLVTPGYQQGYYRYDPGWRMLDIGIFKLKPDIPYGDDARYYVARGFWWNIHFWLPWRFQK